MSIDMTKLCYREDENGGFCFGHVYSLYVFSSRRWVKVGELCLRCGVHLSEDWLKRIELG